MLVTLFPPLIWNAIIIVYLVYIYKYIWYKTPWRLWNQLGQRANKCLWGFHTQLSLRIRMHIPTGLPSPLGLCRVSVPAHLSWFFLVLRAWSVVPGFILASASSSPNHYQLSPFIFFFSGFDFKVAESQRVFLPPQCNHPSAQSYLIRLGFSNSRCWDKDLDTSNLSWRGF